MSNISRNIQGFEIYQREGDGYINATQVCKANQALTGQKKDPSDWLANKSSKSMIEKLLSVTGIPASELVDVKKGGTNQGTWLHPRLAVRFAMWVNDDFSLQVEDWVQEWIATKRNPIHTIAPAEPTIAEIEQVFAPLYKLGIKEGLIKSAVLTSIAASIPRLEPSVENAKQLISASLPVEEVPISPTKLGIIFADQNNLDKPPSGLLKAGETGDRRPEKIVFINQ